MQGSELRHEDRVLGRVMAFWGSSMTLQEYDSVTGIIQTAWSSSRRIKLRELQVLVYQRYTTVSTTATSRRSFLGRRGARTTGLSLNRLGLALPLGLLRRRIPVVDHLQRKNKVEGEARDEAVQDELVIDLLEGSEDAREGAGEIVEDLRV